MFRQDNNVYIKAILPISAIFLQYCYNDGRTYRIDVLGQRHRVNNKWSTLALLAIFMKQGVFEEGIWFRTLLHAVLVLKRGLLMCRKHNGQIVLRGPQLRSSESCSQCVRVPLVICSVGSVCIEQRRSFRLERSHQGKGVRATSGHGVLRLRYIIL